MIGKKFGRLEVVSLLDRRSSGGRLLYECKCECGNLKTALVGSLHSGHTKSCGCLRREMCRQLKLRKRGVNFSDWYDVSPSGCWNWNRGKNKSGYGSFRIDGKNVLAHRYSYELFNGAAPDELLVCHKCDNPSCVNPAHLFLGTHADNSHDKSEKLRGIHGVKNPHSKLTEAQALFILAANLPLAMLAKMFSVRHQSISAIKRGVTWSYLKKRELVK